MLNAITCVKRINTTAQASHIACRIKPVSYTHLDVYKRQLLCNYLFGKRSAGHVLAFKVKHGIPIGITQNIHRLTVACALGGQSGLVGAGFGVIQGTHHLIGDKIIRGAVDEQHRLFTVLHLLQGGCFLKAIARFGSRRGAGRCV